MATLSQLHREWLTRYELPKSSQDLLKYFFDRDSAATGLSELLECNPALPAVLGQYLDSKMQGFHSEVRSLEFVISRIGLDSVRRIVLDHQLRLHLRLALGLKITKPLAFSYAGRFSEKVEKITSRIVYGDSAFVGGMIWDLLAIQELSVRERNWIESRFSVAVETMERAISISEERVGFPNKRWLVASVSSLFAAEAIVGLIDAPFAEKVLLWERRKIPAAVQSLMKSQHLGFSVHAAAAWICSRVTILEPVTDALLYADFPQSLKNAPVEVRSLAEVLSRATELT
ncbi:MAG: HDOD domain-containing protein [Bdellovibrionales bacterium]|nr:HDOD domain-containing protein [Bdellovibrionales bacterium]